MKKLIKLAAETSESKVVESQQSEKMSKPEEPPGCLIEQNRAKRQVVSSTYKSAHRAEQPCDGEAHLMTVGLMISVEWTKA